MLEVILETTLVPGSNLEGDVPGGDWTVLLPARQVEQVVCWGLPTAATLTTLVACGREVTVLCSGSRQRQRARRLLEKHSLSEVRLMDQAQAEGGGLPEGGVDVLLLANRRAVRRLGQDGPFRQACRGWLNPQGVIYIEFRGPLWLLLGRAARRAVRREFQGMLRLWVTPLWGEMRTAVAWNDRGPIAYFLQRGLSCPSLSLQSLAPLRRSWQRNRGGQGHRSTDHTGSPRRLKWAVRRLGRGLLDAARRLEQWFYGRDGLRGGLGRSALILGRPAGQLAHHGPSHLHGLAEQAGIDLDGYRWGFVSNGQFSSRKLLFYLFAPHSSSPQYLVKMTRQPRFNARLERECQALRKLDELAVGPKGTLPKVIFAGEHDGLAVVGETMLPGLPFDQCTHQTADCPYARAAIDWLIELSAVTADPLEASTAQVAEGLHGLLVQLADTYGLTSGQQAFLAEQLAAVAGSPQPLPLVFQHGDPGCWNVLAQPDHQVAFLDWEAAEPKGLPLWDLLYFLRSYCVRTARRRGMGGHVEDLTRLLLQDPAVGRLAVKAIRRYCTQTGLPAAMVEPLFYSCWMHRALKESTRLPPDRLRQGHYFQLLTWCIEHRHAGPLDRFFQLATSERLKPR